MRRGEIWLVNLDPTVGSEIQKTRPISQEEGTIHEHFFEGKQPLGQLRQQLFLLLSPLIEATPPKLPLFVPEKAETIGDRHHFFPIDIV